MIWHQPLKQLLDLEHNMAIYQPGVNMMTDGGNSPIALSPEQIAARLAVSDARANAEATAKLVG